MLNPAADTRSEKKSSAPHINAGDSRPGREHRIAPLAPETKFSILCIGDEVPVLAILASKLSGDGYDVRTASDRQAIVAELQKRPPPHLILLDMGLPGFGGFQTYLYQPQSVA